VPHKAACWKQNWCLSMQLLKLTKHFKDLFPISSTTSTNLCYHASREINTSGERLEDVMFKGSRAKQQRHRRYGKAFNASPVTVWFDGFWLFSELLHSPVFPPGNVFLTSLRGPTWCEEMQGALVRRREAVVCAGAHPPMMLVRSHLLTSQPSICGREGSQKPGKPI